MAKKLEELTEEEKTVYDKACADFQHSRTYNELCTSIESAESLKHRYGLLKVEQYNRNYTRERRVLGVD